MLLGSVIVVGAVATGLAFSLLQTSSSNAKMTAVDIGTAKSYLYSENCIESALQSLRDDSGYVGPSTIVYSDGDCSAEISVGAGENRTIESTGTSGFSQSLIEVEVVGLSPVIVIDSWKEIPPS